MYFRYYPLSSWHCHLTSTRQVNRTCSQWSFLPLLFSSHQEWYTNDILQFNKWQCQLHRPHIELPLGLLSLWCALSNVLALPWALSSKHIPNPNVSLLQMLLPHSKKSSSFNYDSTINVQLISIQDPKQSVKNVSQVLLQFFPNHFASCITQNKQTFLMVYTVLLLLPLWPQLPSFSLSLLWCSESLLAFVAQSPCIYCSFPLKNSARWTHSLLLYILWPILHGPSPLLGIYHHIIPVCMFAIFLGLANYFSFLYI